MLDKALLFKDVATFDAQSPIIGSLLREIDLAKKRKESALIDKQLQGAPSVNDTILIQRFKKFKETPVNYNNNNDDDDNDDNNKKPPSVRLDHLPLHLHLLSTIFKGIFNNRLINHSYPNQHFNHKSMLLIGLSLLLVQVNR